MSDDGGGARGPARYYAMHDWSAAEPLSFSVVRAVATRSGKDPAAVQSLHDVVDPDALDALFADRRGRNGALSFTLDGHDVTVHADGGIVVDARYRADSSA